MDSRGAGYWVCRNCGHHNLRQLSMCVSCDEPASSGSPSRHVSTPLRPTGSASATPTSASRHYETGSAIRTASPERSRYDAVNNTSGTYSPSPAARQNTSATYTSSPRGPGGSSPPRSTYHAQAFVQDLDNKNAVIARLERHVQTMVEQQGRMKKAHESEIAGIESQMHQAIDAHRLLMQEYRQCASDLSNAHTELCVTKSEVSSLQEKVTNESRRRVEQAEQQLAEMEQKQREVRSAKEAAATAQDSLREAQDEIARLTGRQAAAAQSPSSQRSDANASLQLTEMAARNEELAATVERLRYDLEASRSSLEEARNRYTDDLKRVMRESTQANEKAVAGVASELAKVREASENAANRDRQYVEHQLKDANDLATRLQGQLEREGSRYTERIRELEGNIKRLQEQRDSMMEESRFSSEIQQDYVKEQTQLKAEISSLKAALRDAEARRSGSAPPALSAANSSHGGSNAAKQTEAAVAADVDAMNNSVRDAVGGVSPRGTSAADDMAARLTAAEDALGQKDVTISSLRGKLDTQGAALELEKERHAEAREEIEALREALDILQEEARENPSSGTAGKSDGADASSSSAAAAAELEKLKEEYENLDSKYMFDTSELRKQVTNMQKKLRDREGDLEEMAAENEQYVEALEELRKNGNGGGAAAAGPAATAGGSGGGGDVAALQAEVTDLKQSLQMAQEARDSKDDLLEVKEKEFEAQKQQLMETITRITDDLKASSTDSSRLREELDAANRALEDSEAVCRDALQSLRHEL